MQRRRPVKGSTKRWFKVAGACCAVGAVLMLAALALVGFDARRLSLPLPTEIGQAAAPSALAAPASSGAFLAAAAPDKSVAASADAEEPAAFDFSDKVELNRRAFAAVADAIW